MGGLNDGLELEDELAGDQADGKKLTELETQVSVDETLFETVEPGEIPEVDKDVSIATVVDKTQDLGYLKQDITDTQGMNRTFALELEKLVPGFLSEERPLGYFTDQPTKTLYKVSLEAIEDEQKSILRRIWNSIVEFLKKAMDWVKGLFDGMTKRVKVKESTEFYSKDTQKTSDDLDIVQKGYKNPKDVVAKVQGLVKDKDSEAFKVYVTNLEEKLTSGEKRLENFYETINKRNELYAIATKSSVIDKILNVGFHASEIISSYKVFDKEMLKGLAAMYGKPEELAVKVESIRQSVLSIAATYEANTFEGYARQISASLNKREQRAVKPETASLSQLFATFRDVFKKYNIDAFMKHLHQSRDSLEEIQRNINEITLMGPYTSKDREMNYSFVNDIFRIIYGELRGMLQLIAIAVNLFTAWSWIADTMVGLSQDFSRRVSLHLADLDEDSKKVVSEYFDIALKPATP